MVSPRLLRWLIPFLLLCVLGLHEAAALAQETPEPPGQPPPVAKNGQDPKKEATTPTDAPEAASPAAAYAAAVIATLLVLALVCTPSRKV